MASWHTEYSAWQYCAQTASVRHSPTAENPLAPPSGTAKYEGQSVTLLVLPPQLTPAAPTEHQRAKSLKTQLQMEPFILIGLDDTLRLLKTVKDLFG